MDISALTLPKITVGTYHVKSKPNQLMEEPESTELTQPTVALLVNLNQQPTDT